MRDSRSNGILIKKQKIRILHQEKVEDEREMCIDWEIMNQGVLLLRRIVTLEAKVVNRGKGKENVCIFKCS